MAGRCHPHHLPGAERASKRLKRCESFWYGHAFNAYHTVRTFERAGVAGLKLEDQMWPKRCGHLQGKEAISAEEVVQKIRATAEARVEHPGT
jgi:2-methylisocitrate lyase-like PEP mutase family enzyme